jgi:hypothetical protein
MTDKSGLRNSMKFFQPNLATRGRFVRALGGGLFLLAAILFRKEVPLLSIALGVAGAFMAFEAARGWCVVRACGIKTPL